MYCTQTTESIIMRPSPDFSPAILVFPCQIRGDPLIEGVKWERVSKSRKIWPLGDVDQSRCSKVTLSSINSAWLYYGPVIAQFIYSARRFVSDSWASCSHFRTALIDTALGYLPPVGTTGYVTYSWLRTRFTINIMIAGLLNICSVSNKLDDITTAKSLPAFRR